MRSKAHERLAGSSHAKQTTTHHETNNPNAIRHQCESGVAVVTRTTHRVLSPHVRWRQRQASVLCTHSGPHTAGGFIVGLSSS